MVRADDLDRGQLARPDAGGQLGGREADDGAPGTVPVRPGTDLTVGSFDDPAGFRPIV